MEARVLTIEELAAFDGKEGRAAYVAFEGKVYDLTDSAEWEAGLHQEEHPAGTDLTDDMDFAPHGMELLEGFPVVGRLTD
jgi:predicted heme/steroid binding protein